MPEKGALDVKQGIVLKKGNVKIFLGSDMDEDSKQYEYVEGEVTSFSIINLSKRRHTIEEFLEEVSTF